MKLEISCAQIFLEPQKSSLAFIRKGEFFPECTSIYIAATPERGDDDYFILMLLSRPFCLFPFEYLFLAL